jgi:cysteine desulfurase / selenocysteine lyase
MGVSLFDVKALRDEFVGLDQTVYLNTGGLGLMPRATRQAIQEEHAALGTVLDPTAWYLDCVARSAGLRERVARFVGASPDEIALKTSVADGYGSVLWGLEWEEGDEIVVSSEEHPTPRLAVELAARYFGLRVKTVPLQATGDAFLAEIERSLGPSTRLIALSHITTDSGTVLPAQQICRLAARAGVLTLFDGAHAVGQVPLDLHALGCDFYASMGYKWALGPMGSGFLYVRREGQDLLRPIVGGGGLDWRELAAGHAGDGGAATRFEFASRAWPEFFGLGRSLEFLDGIGVPRIREHVRHLTRRLRDGLREIAGVAIHTPDDPEPSTGILAFSLHGMPPRDLSQALRERWNVAQRAAMMVGAEGGVRISLALYTAPEEVDLLLDAVRTLARECA